MRWLPRDGDRRGARRKKANAISAWHSRSRTRSEPEVGERGRYFFRCASRFGVALADAAMDGGGIGTGDSGGW